MSETLISYYSLVAKWLNENQGVAGVGIFLLTLFLGWVSGIFSALRRKPKFKTCLIDGPTFTCTFETGKKHLEESIHRTGIALYLSIANIGSAASSISDISVAYHWNIHPFRLNWLRYKIGWFWLEHPTVIMHDFQSVLGENIKRYPFLIQESHSSNNTTKTFLEPGESSNGIVYFEQPDCWGGCYPLASKSGVRIKVAVHDVFGRTHKSKFTIRQVNLEHARTYNQSFGKTYAEIRNETLPHDSNNK